MKIRDRLHPIQLVITQIMERRHNHGNYYQLTTNPARYGITR